jgi:UDP-GlcNAc3NAcA epimerase
LSMLNLLNNKVIFSLHPRTRNILKSNSIDLDSYNNIKFIDPVGYLENISYQKFSECVITDSGGMQKEAYMLQKKCITIRTETEWVETLNNGWNTLLFDNLDDIKSIIDVDQGKYIPNLYGDGKSAVAIVEIIRQFF